MAVAGKGKNGRAACRQGCPTRRGFLKPAAVGGTLLLAHGQARGYAANEQLQVWNRRSGSTAA